MIQSTVNGSIPHPVAPVSTGLNQAQSIPEGFDLIEAVRHHRWLCALGITLGIAAALAYQFLAVPKYEAVVQIMLMQRNTAMPSSGESSATPHAEGIALAENVLASHMQLLGSRRILQDAIDRYEIGELESLQREVEFERDPVYYLQNNMKLSLGGDGAARAANVVTVALRDTSPNDCAVILNAIVSSYQDFIRMTFFEINTDAIEVITSTRDSVTKQLEEAEKRYIDFRQTAPLIWEDDIITNRHQKRAQDIQEELVMIRERESEVRSRLGIINQELKNKQGKLSDGDALALLSDAETDRLRLFLQITKGDVASEEFQAQQPVRAATANTQYEQLLSLMLTERSLLADFGAEHPKVNVVRDQIKVIQDYLETHKASDVEQQELTQLKPKELLDAYVALLMHDQKELSGRNQELQTELDAELAKSGELFVFERKAMALVDEIDQLRRTQQVVTERLGDMALKQQYGGSLPEVITPPMPASAPAWPILPIVVAIGTVCGLLLGTGLAVVAELSDSTFRNPSQLHAVMGVPITAHVPFNPVKRHDKNSQVDRSVFVRHDPSGTGAEAIRRVRTHLFFEARNSGSNVFAVTSPIPGDGKSLLAANLALAIANTGRSVLLIDADMRRPRQQKLFGCATQPGLLEVLLTETEWQDALVSVDGIDRFHVLPCGDATENPAERLNLPSFRHFLENAREKFDFVILDTPPLLAVSDPGIICEYVDGVIFATTIRKNGREAVVSAKRILDELHARIVSVVVNCTSRSDRGFGYVDRDKRCYEYGYASDRVSDRYRRSGTAPASLLNGQAPLVAAAPAAATPSKASRKRASTK
ncbi:MAG: GumC family protein [Planctomycetaceae bacterium]